MSTADLGPNGPISDRTVARFSFLCKLATVLGILLHIIFYTGPARPLTLSVFLIGGGLAGYAFVFMYQNQPQMTPSHLMPYLLGLLLAVTVLSTGIGYGYVDRRVGLPFLVVMAGTVMLFARFFTYQPST